MADRSSSSNGRGAGDAAAAAAGLGRTLTIPPGWAEELCSLRNPELDQPIAGPEVLVLSHDPARSAGWGVDLDDVATDLAQGMSLRPGNPYRGQPRFWVTGTRYRVEVVSRPAKEARWPLAFVLRSYANDERLTRRAGRVVRPVRFAEVWDEQRCDIELLHRELEQGQSRQRALHDARKALRTTHRDNASFRHAELHAEARQRYGALRSLLALLRQRAERTAVSADGVVTRVPSGTDEDGTSDPYLHVELDFAGSRHDFADVLIELTSPSLRGQPPRTTVRDATGRVLAVDLPRRGEWTVGMNVVVTTKPRFSMKQNDIALERFLRGQVEGNWDDLATLLCKPGRLRLAAPPLPPRFFCDEDPGENALNEEQRRAVAGALATPHAFVIQGPPGTGKTTVISEIVRQLVARGERVLMLAPSHVAVDEVLRRIGRKPGVRALRLAWEEAKVDEGLRGFLPDRAGREFAGALRTPGPDSDALWKARHASLVAERDAIDRLLAALSERDGAVAARSRAEAAEQRVREERAAARRRHAEALEHAAAQLRRAEIELDAANRTVDHAQVLETQARTELDASRQPLEELLAALRRLAGAADERTAAGEAVHLAAQRHDGWHEGWRIERLQREAAAADLRTRTAAAVVAASDALRQLQAAETRLAAVSPRRGPLARLADQAGVGALARRTAAVDAARQAWHDVDGERRRLEHDGQRMVAEQRRLLAGEQSTADDLASDVQVAGSRLRTAEDRQAAAVEQWAQVTRTAVGHAQPPPALPATLGEQIHAVLQDPGTTAQLPQDLVPFEFRQAHGRLRSAVEQRVQRQRRRLELEDTLSDARQALDRARSVGSTEEARTAAAASAAATEVERRRFEEQESERRLADGMTVLGRTTEPTAPELHVQRARRDRQIRVLPSFPRLRQRWVDLVAGLSLERAVNVVCATTQGTGPLRDADFDTLIVDEASRVVDSEFLVGAIRARRWVLVGDEHQLPPFVDNHDEHLLHALAALHREDRQASVSLGEAVAHLADLWTGSEDDEQRQFRASEVEQVAADLRATSQWPDVYGETFAAAHQFFARTKEDPDRGLLGAMRRHLTQSLLERAVAVPHDDIRQPLVVQRRMIAAMAAIVRGPIYGGRYESADDVDLERCGVRPLTTTSTFTHPVVLLDTRFAPRHAEQNVGHGYHNELECRWVVEACRRYEREMARDEKTVTVSILCFYQAQAELIRERLKPPRYPGFHRLKFRVIAPVDRIQGQESDLVFVTFTRSNSRPGPMYGQWLQDVRRLNVACTRAHRALVLVGNGEMLQRLRTRPKAQAFYQNLFQLYAKDGNDFLHIEDFLAPGDGRT
jgi:hypothetical protein